MSSVTSGSFGDEVYIEDEISHTKIRLYTFSNVRKGDLASFIYLPNTCCGFIVNENSFGETSKKATPFNPFLAVLLFIVMPLLMLAAVCWLAYHYGVRRRFKMQEAAFYVIKKCERNGKIEYLGKTTGKRNGLLPVNIKYIDRGRVSFTLCDGHIYDNHKKRKYDFYVADVEYARVTMTRGINIYLHKKGKVLSFPCSEMSYIMDYYLRERGVEIRINSDYQNEFDSCSKILADSIEDDEKSDSMF